MREPNDDTANVNEGSPIGPASHASQLSEWTGELDPFAGLDPELGPQLAPLLALLRLGPDAVIDQLCEGHPRDFMGECAEHVRDNAYFIEEGRVAARVIATLATYACDIHPTGPPGTDLAEQLGTIVEEATAAVLEEGALDGDAGAEPDPVVQRIGLVLGADDRRARGMLNTLNAFEFADRHVLFHCIVGGLSPEAYAKKFNDDPRVVTVMLRSVAKMAMDGPLDGSPS